MHVYWVLQLAIITLNASNEGPLMFVYLSLVKLRLKYQLTTLKMYITNRLLQYPIYTYIYTVRTCVCVCVLSTGR